MTRVIVQDGDGARDGHFEWEKSRRWSDGDRNGYGEGSRGAGRGAAMILTSGGRWVRELWTQYEGDKNTYRFTTPERAREWLLRNGFDTAVEELFAEQLPEEEDRRPGRPPIGGAVHIKLGDDLLAMVDEYASRHSVNRAEAIRRLLAREFQTVAGNGETGEPS